MTRVVFALAFSLAAAAAQAVPDFADVKQNWRSSEATLADRHGQPMQLLRLDPVGRRLGWVPLEDTSPALRLAMLLSEDKRFYEHSGIDWRSVAAAAWGNLWHTRTRGASTITMQLAGLLEGDAARPAGTGARGLVRKANQVRIAKILEATWRKDEILEAYLNLVPFRGELVGLAALAQTMFAKDPGGLDAAEAALAAALVRAPNALAPVVARRACALLREQGLERHCGEVEGLAASSLAPGRTARLAPEESLAPHLARRLLARPGETVRSTLDRDLQRLATATLRRHLLALAARNVEDGAVIVLDNASGDVLAWVGSSGASLSSAYQVDAAAAPRQAGSTLKPFLYALAFEGRWLTPASLLEDAPVNLDSGSGLYLPRNYDRTYKGLVSARTALASSLNVPAVRASILVTPERMRQRLRAVGLSTVTLSADYYGYSLALGAADVTLAELTNAYRVLADGGRYRPLRLRMDALQPRPARVMDERAAFLVADILSDRTARARTFGLDNALATRVWTAVKTGTSKDIRDNWCIGFSRRYTVGVWVGNASGAPMHDVSGMHGAAPVWQDLISALHANEPSTPPAAPRGLVRGVVSFADAIEPPRLEWFLAGTERRVVAPASSERAALAIADPADGTVFAHDPDIPSGLQLLQWQARGEGSARALWRLDGRPAARGARHAWFPLPGRHLLELVDSGRVVDAVHIEVRGAVPFPPR